MFKVLVLLFIKQIQFNHPPLVVEQNNYTTKIVNEQCLHYL